MIESVCVDVNRWNFAEKLLKLTWLVSLPLKGDGVTFDQLCCC